MQNTPAALFHTRPYDPCMVPLGDRSADHTPSADLPADRLADCEFIRTQYAYHAPT